jgi:hypothetical protein
MSFFTEILVKPYEAPFGPYFGHEQSQYITVRNQAGEYEFTKRDYDNLEHMKIICDSGLVVSSWKSRPCLGCQAEQQRKEEAKYMAKLQVRTINEIIEATNISPDLAGVITEHLFEDVSGQIGVQTYFAFNALESSNEANELLGCAEKILYDASERDLRERDKLFFQDLEDIIRHNY